VRDPKWAFGFPWKLAASAFETAVWDAIRAIPSGQVRTYGDIARRVRSVPRAVGGACGRNPLPLVIPCHRVVGATGIGGFMGGHEHDPLAIKRWLLTHEGATQPSQAPETLALWDAPPGDARATR
jgi:methylated-DNA-[protein]-cysteine S-methyltransferase